MSSVLALLSQISELDYEENKLKVKLFEFSYSNFFFQGVLLGKFVK